MKKILIINNNLDMGGIQKSLINLLKEVHQDYNITLLLFSKSGVLLNDVPVNVKIITPNKCYQMLGLTKSELKRYPLLFCLKYLFMKYASIFSRRSAMRLLGTFQKKIKGYDVVISYSHLSDYKYFANGCGDFVLDKTIGNRKICFVHCDYLNSGTMSKQNNTQYSEFDKIACCSDSVRKRFLDGSQISSNKVFTVRNFYDLDIVKLANNKPYLYEGESINILTVARLSSEKGIDRAIDAFCATGRKELKYYIIGTGPQMSALENRIKDYHMEKQVFLLGEQKNPYRYMLNADYLLVPSLHEAAPIVFDEANILGVPIITSNTTSAQEIAVKHGGTICDSFEEIENTLRHLKKIKSKEKTVLTNKTQLNQFVCLESE